MRQRRFFFVLMLSVLSTTFLCLYVLHCSDGPSLLPQNGRFWGVKRNLRVNLSEGTPASRAHNSKGTPPSRAHTSKETPPSRAHTFKGIPVSHANASSGNTVLRKNTSKGNSAFGTNASKGIPAVHANASKNIPASHARSSAPCVTIARMRGQLGNNMFQYAALLGIAATNNHSHAAVLSSQSKLRGTFSLNALDRHGGCNRTVMIRERGAAVYNAATQRLPAGNVSLLGYFQSWRYFQHVSPLIASEFTFNDSVRRSAATLLTKTVSEREKATRVGVHVRHWMMDTKVKRDLGYVYPSVSYFQRAAAYFRDKYHDVIFILVTDDVEWCRQNLMLPDFVIANKSHWRVHFSLLTQCDHVIQSVGTFGWWAGYLAGGEVVYYRDWVGVNSKASRTFHVDDYYMPHWIGLGD